MLATKPASLRVCEDTMANRFLSESAIIERERLFRLSMIAGSNMLRDTIAEEHPRIMRILLEKQKRK